jgi:hypothetical protein
MGGEGKHEPVIARPESLYDKIRHTLAPNAGMYEHFKGKQYRVWGIALRPDTNESLVLYQAWYDTFALMLRPLVMFQEMVERDGVRKPRFRHLADAIVPPAVLAGPFDGVVRAVHSETGELFAVYRTFAGMTIMALPINDFLAQVKDTFSCDAGH